jgi:abhydrolase domain-containing protein 12
MIDYRGFGDSEGVPSQEGLIDDAHAAWNWLLENGARQEDISIFGSSLGTAVGTHLVHELAKVGEHLPISSIRRSL